MTAPVPSVVVHLDSHPDGQVLLLAPWAAKQLKELLPTALLCLACRDEGHVCEDHPDQPWEGTVGPIVGHPEHGGAGMPCLACCSPIPQDGTHSIHEAFVPDWQRVPCPV